MRVKLVKSLVLFLCIFALLSAQVALSQTSATKWDEKPIDYKYKFEEMVNIRDAWTEAYDFVIDASKRNNIGSKLRRLNDDQRSNDRDDFQYLMPHRKIGQDQDRAVLTNEIKTEMGFAVAKQAMESFGFLKKISRHLKFKVNLFEVDPEDELAEQRRRRNFRIRPKKKSLKEETTAVPKQTAAKQSTSSGFGLVAPDEQQYSNEEVYVESQKTEKWRQMGQIEAGLRPSNNPNNLVNEDPSQSNFMFSLSQGNGFYSLNLPVGAGNVSEGMTHGLRVPVYRTAKVGRDFDFKGNAVTSGLYNISASEREFEPRINIIYDHTKEHYGSECVVKNPNRSEVSLRTTTPAPTNIKQKDLKNKGSEYSVAYAMPF